MSPRPLGGALAFALAIAAPALLDAQSADAGPAAPTVAVGDALTWPMERAYRSKRPIEAVRDSISGEVTTSVVVDKGQYLLWMRRPRVTVASVRPAELPAGEWPAAVLIEFRTQSPQYTSTNVLTLTADDSLRFHAAASASRVRHRTFVNEHTLTFMLPLADFLRFAQGTRGHLEVGGVRVIVKPDQLEALRAFARQVHTSGVASSGA
jgi:hypothetical protein